MNITESRLRRIIRDELEAQEGIIHWDRRTTRRTVDSWSGKKIVDVFVPATFFTPVSDNSMSQVSYAEEEQVKAFVAMKRAEDGIMYRLYDIKWLGKNGGPGGTTHKISLAYNED